MAMPVHPPTPISPVHSSSNTARKFRQLPLVPALLFLSTYSFLYIRPILESFAAKSVWLDHTSIVHHGDDDDDDDAFRTMGNPHGDNSSRQALAGYKLHRSNGTEPHWSHQWLDGLATTKGAPYILYVHVGKTGGITLERGVPIPTPAIIQTLQCIVAQLNSTQHHIALHDAKSTCLSRHYPRHHKAAKLTNHILAHKHLWSALYKPHEMEFAIRHSDTILITTRNPVDRIVSAFNYHRNELVETILRGNNQELKKMIQNERLFAGNGMKEIFYNCFPDVREMAEELARIFHLNHNNDTITSIPHNNSNPAIVYNQMTCGQLAHRLLSRTHPKRTAEWSHYSSNYRWYTKLTWDKRPDAAVLVIRTEYLWEDATEIEVALGGSERAFIASAKKSVSHGSERYQVTAKLESETQKRAVCCAIYDDLQAYQDIIMSALNLSDEDKKEMMQMVWKDCGVNIEDYEEGVVNGPMFWEEWFVKKSCNNIKSRR
eukprot:CCRYP_017630-RB/>CCRYP_017630-RB protein AED:0.01 eAED:0.01 QI:53/-1/1/1/-1/1/1/17/487